jgi:hypothetical protein
MSDLRDLDLWRQTLGLFPVPLSGQQDDESAFVLLNGTQGNFCLDLARDPLVEDARSTAWSVNVGHHIAVTDTGVELRRWDQSQSTLERYSLTSVVKDLARFHAYLERTSPRNDNTIISHTIRVFRSLRAVMGSSYTGHETLRAFLALLACSVGDTELQDIKATDWQLRDDAFEVAKSIRATDWDSLLSDVRRGRPLEELVPKLGLTLRHASGQLFQEAHYEALFVPADQLRLDGFLPVPVTIRTGSALGIHFTPSSLARTLVEEALLHVDRSRPSLVIFDPACGSGEFLRESLRQLRLGGYRGDVHLVGWDISEAACDMAKFSLAWEARRASNATIDISCLDSLATNAQWPRSDAILMNPPFVSWPNMDRSQQDSVRAILGNVTKHRPDMSFAFLWRAADSLGEGGVLGSILPASLLGSQSADAMRKELGERISLHLVARLGSQMLFSGATVDPGLMLATVGHDQTVVPVAFWADHRSASTSAGLRMLRKARDVGYHDALPIDRDGYSIYFAASIAGIDAGWTPRRYTSWRLLHDLAEIPRVGEIFSVHQGIRTGYNQAFLLTSGQLSDLPRDEQTYFRPAVVNRSIVAGRLRRLAFVFHPYGDRSLDTIEQLEAQVPSYYHRFLLPKRDHLAARARVKPSEWWKLSEVASWQIAEAPKLVSTYFGDAGSFAWDDSGEYAVVQGHAWLPKPSHVDTFGFRVGLAYLAIFSSEFFSDLLASVSNHVGGGQWDLSKRFVDRLPLPNLMRSQADPDQVSELAEVGTAIHHGHEVDRERHEQLVRQVYALSG